MGLGDMWHKTLVYFGMADEDDEYYDEQTLTPQDVRESGLPDRAATVRRVDRGVPERMPADRGVSQRSSRSSRRRGVDFDDIFSEEDAFRSQRSAVVRPLPTPVERTPVKVHLVEPKNFNDAQLIADKFKGDIPVILNLQRSDNELSKRLIDFSSGLTYALEGGIERVADKVFLLTPRNVEVSAEEKQRLIEKGFFNQF
ncbi:MAG: Cell division protein SepF [Actinobacteria bacterium ADurb.Bin444]|nr:MAG: Cell division protein SepF [Actinobacteria bacterium ADurb.Bin444]